jgi:hypothetical protein
MRMRYTPVLVGACLFGPGCSFVCNIERNLWQVPKVALDEKLILKRHERLGAMAWDEMVAQYGCQFSEDYRIGFIDGFVDYLTYGGTNADGSGEVPVVPAVPPPTYRRAKAMSPQGLKAAEDWFVGFRHGSSTALASGLRQLVTVPVFDRPIPSREDVPGRYQSLPGRSPDNGGKTPAKPAPTATPPGEGELLPQARPVPPGEPAVKPPAVPGAPPAATPPAATPPAVPGVPPAGPPPAVPPMPPPGPATPPPTGPTIPPG